jgi:hypothetical protein
LSIRSGAADEPQSCNIVAGLQQQVSSRCACSHHKQHRHRDSNEPQPFSIGKCVSSKTSDAYSKAHARRSSSTAHGSYSRVVHHRCGNIDRSCCHVHAHESAAVAATVLNDRASDGPVRFTGSAVNVMVRIALNVLRSNRSMIGAGSVGACIKLVLKTAFAPASSAKSIRKHRRVVWQHRQHCGFLCHPTCLATPDAPCSRTVATRVGKRRVLNFGAAAEAVSAQQQQGELTCCSFIGSISVHRHHDVVVIAASHLVSISTPPASSIASLASCSIASLEHKQSAASHGCRHRIRQRHRAIVIVSVGISTPLHSTSALSLRSSSRIATAISNIGLTLAIARRHSQHSIGSATASAAPSRSLHR